MTGRGDGKGNLNQSAGRGNAVDPRQQGTGRVTRSVSKHQGNVVAAPQVGAGEKMATPTVSATGTPVGDEAGAVGGSAPIAPLTQDLLKDGRSSSASDHPAGPPVSSHEPNPEESLNHLRNLQLGRERSGDLDPSGTYNDYNGADRTVVHNHYLNVPQRPPPSSTPSFGNLQTQHTDRPIPNTNRPRPTSLAPDPTRTDNLIGMDPFSFSRQNQPAFHPTYGPPRHQSHRTAFPPPPMHMAQGPRSDAARTDPRSPPDANWLNRSGGSSRYAASAKKSVAASWNLRFSGRKDDLPCQEFIFRVQTLMRMCQVSPEEMVNNIYFLLQDDAQEWFWAQFCRSSPGASWDRFVYEFCEHFKEMSSDHDVLMAIMNTRQDRDRFDDFLQRVLRLRNQMVSPTAEVDLIEIMRRNLSPRLAQMICFQPVSRLNDFRDVCRKAEKSLEWSRPKTSPWLPVHEVASAALTDDYDTDFNTTYQT